ncbi:kinase-like domain-containing protein [Ilyonectria robusta]|uniref:kinase-like domain-containing protein n=1 Tax=Ilyonectria robusta TaxID=1079257 RepID=UPI001E8D0872|nr:kinase-like domain-containing protein [Ilyonectria robusta]KAH8688220.1 kinase-like domain-containing protein [Ilyonectria robusta]
MWIYGYVASTFRQKRNIRFHTNAVSNGTMIRRNLRKLQHRLSMGSMSRPGEATDPKNIIDTHNHALVPTASQNSHHKLHGSLQNQLFQAMVSNPTQRMAFLPRGGLLRLINEKSVQKQLVKDERRTWRSYLSMGGAAARNAKDIKSCALEICGIVFSGSQGDRPKRLKKSFRKIFAILVLIHESSRIWDFVGEGVCDADLPLIETRGEHGRKAFDLRRKHAADLPLRCLRGWKQSDMSRFAEWQWTMIAPVFSRASDNIPVHYVLSPDVILPYVSARSENEGGFSRVFKVFIHPDHNNLDSAEEPHQGFAVKRLYSRNRKSFDKEVEVLKMLNRASHPHLISLLASYEQHGEFNVIFHWADANLLEYWEKVKPKPAFDRTTMLWVAEQCQGIAEGLSVIHHIGSLPENQQVGQTSSSPPFFGYHGDISTQNILWFSKPRYLNDMGTLKISDFGTASLRVVPSARMAMSPTYGAPDGDMLGSKPNSSFDIWSLGCVYLEFATWLLGGERLLQHFCLERVEQDPDRHFKSDCFFELVNEEDTNLTYPRVKSSVIKCFAELHTLCKQATYFHEFLDIIQQSMIKIEQTEPWGRSRLGSSELSERLALMYERCVRETTNAPP